MSRGQYWLAHASRIGERLVESAIRHGGRCAWTGRTAAEPATTRGDAIPVVTAIGPLLYDGTAGIALFLGELHAHTQTNAFRCVALEAMTHALDHADTSSPFGFYDGAPGIAFAAARLSLLLGAPALGDRARQVLDRCAESPLASAGCDVMTGLAGSLIALLASPQELWRARDLDACMRIGTALAAAATPLRGAWAWTYERAAPHVVDGALLPLTGISHGASGMGIPLLELHARTGEKSFGDVARGALAYEALCFDHAMQNWPDYRILDELAGSAPTFSIGWCHGAAGIALARRHALSVEPNMTWSDEWKTGCATALRAARDLHEPGSDVTLCHGLAGCIEPLFEASRERPALRATIERLWAPHVSIFAGEGRWRSGTPSRGPNPSLMLGTAGVGYTFLRMHDPSVPSILLPLLK